MKKGVMFVLMMVFAVRLNAYEIEGNPDRKMSIGLNYDRSGATSEYKFGTLKISDFTKGTQDQFLVDVKFPISSFFTFGIRGGYLSSKNDVFTGEQTTATG